MHPQSPSPSYNLLPHGGPLSGNRYANTPTGSPNLGQRRLASEPRPASPLVERSEVHHTVITKTSWIESGRESTTNFKLHGSPLPLVWILVEDNIIPPNAVPFGEDKNGSSLYIARALLEGSLYLGKVGTHLPHALISYAGREHQVKEYEVLVCASQLRWGLASYESEGSLSQGTVILAQQNQQLQQSRQGTVASQTGSFIARGSGGLNAQTGYTSRGFSTQTSYSNVQEMTTRSTHNSLSMSSSIGTTLFVTDIPRIIPNMSTSVPPVDDGLKKLANYKTVILIDDSMSMDEEKSWTLVREALADVADIANKYGSQGIDLHFLHQDNFHKNIKTSQEVQDIFDRVHPDGQDTPTAAKLDQLINMYLPLLERKNSRHDPIDIIIITDGVATDEYALPDVIVGAARRLDRHRVPERMFGIQFVQIGTDPDAAAALHNLADHLAKEYKTRDIVDTTPFDPQQGAFDTQYMLKILLGGIDKDLDNGALPPNEPPLPPTSIPQRGNTFGPILA